MDIKAKNGDATLFRAFCDVMEKGGKPDQQLLNELYKLISPAIEEFDELNSQAKKSGHANAVARSIARNLDFTKKKHAPKSTLEETSKRVNAVMSHLKGKSLIEVADELHKDERTIKGYLDTHKGRAKQSIKAQNNINIFLNIYRDFTQLTENYILGVIHPAHDYISYTANVGELFIKPPTKKQLFELTILYSTHKDSNDTDMLLIDWWFSNTVYDSIDGTRPHSEPSPISEADIKSAIKFIACIHALFD